MIGDTTFDDLYHRIPEKTLTSGLDILSHDKCKLVSHIDGLFEYSDEFNDTGRLQVRVLKHFNHDVTRFWNMSTVWFKLNEVFEPVMVIQNAGRHGDDWAKKYITDVRMYRSMVQHITSLKINDGGDEITELYDIHSSHKNITKFYGDELDGYFEKNPF